MNQNFKNIPAIGQMDPTACWAACLSWWLKAVRETTKTQDDLLSMFATRGQVCADDGQIIVPNLKDRISANNAIFQMKMVDVAPSNLAGNLSGAPVIIGFKTPANTGHMNVIYDFDEKSNKVQAMEPWFPNLKIEYSIEPSGVKAPYLNTGDKFIGTHITRNLSYYQNPLGSGGTVLLGIPVFSTQAAFQAKFITRNRAAEKGYD